MLLLPEGQTGKAWESSKKQQSSLCYVSGCVAMDEVDRVLRKLDVERLDAVWRNLPARTEKNMKEISDSESSGRDLNLWPPEYKQEMLLHTQTYYEM